MIEATVNSNLSSYSDVLHCNEVSHHRKRISCEGRGSLPLKKRRFYDESASSSSTETPKDVEGRDELLPSKNDLHRENSDGSSPSSSSFSVAGNENHSCDDDENVAALALLASAATPATSSMSYHHHSSSSSSSSHHGFVIATKQSLEDSSLNSPIPSTSLMSPLHPTSLVSVASKEMTHCTSSPSTPKSRLQLMRLSSPLPNGCHGRTSRNNSYCRRQPCFNGSNYCKLHYQQYVVAGLRSPTSSTTTVENHHYPSSAATTTTMDLAGTSVLLTSPSTVSLQGAPELPNILHQDKRFTGIGDEVRCLATTTRGRACAYVAVKSSKYCHLHADYDTNPPPRRGGASLRMTLAPSLSTFMDGVVMINQHHDTLLVDADSTSCGGPSLAQPEGAHRDHDRHDHPDHPSRSSSSSSSTTLVMLSMISTDRWQGKHVIVATGPFMNRSGIVEKWGNGWVTVKIPGSGPHNRRSFELFLHPNQPQHQDQPQPPHHCDHEKAYIEEPKKKTSCTETMTMTRHPNCNSKNLKDGTLEEEQNPSSMTISEELVSSSISSPRGSSPVSYHQEFDGRTYCSPVRETQTFGSSDGRHVVSPSTPFHRTGLYNVQQGDFGVETFRSGLPTLS